jgi:dihydrofolate reductase
MRKLIVSEFLTLDGVMQAPGNPDEDRSGGFDRGGWQLDYFDDALGAYVMGALESTDAYLLGRRTYEIFAAHWPKQGPEDPLAGMFNNTTKYVVSTTLNAPLEWQNSQLIQGDVPAEIAKVKAAAGKDIQLIGSGQLVDTLTKNDLVDEYRLMIHPVVLGKGKRLFREGTPAKLRVIDSKTTSTGVVMVTYAPERNA